MSIATAVYCYFLIIDHSKNMAARTFYQNALRSENVLKSKVEISLASEYLSTGHMPIVIFFIPAMYSGKMYMSPSFLL